MGTCNIGYKVVYVQDYSCTERHCFRKCHSVGVRTKLHRLGQLSTESILRLRTICVVVVSESLVKGNKAQHYSSVCRCASQQQLETSVM